MEFEISTKRRMENFIKSRISAVVLYVLYGGICELYQLDGRVRDEIDSWPEGMTYCLACSEKGPRLFFRKSQNQLQRLNPRIQRFYDTAITFRSLESAFEVLTGRMGIAQAYGAHAFSLHGDIGTAMELTRCVDVVDDKTDFEKSAAQRGQHAAGVSADFNWRPAGSLYYVGGREKALPD